VVPSLEIDSRHRSGGVVRWPGADLAQQAWHTQPHRRRHGDPTGISAALLRKPSHPTVGRARQRQARRLLFPPACVCVPRRRLYITGRVNPQPHRDLDVL